MTEVAATAGAAIGSLYQFFPTKPPLADALYLHDMNALTTALRTAVDEILPCPLHVIADSQFVTLLAFIETHPALPNVSDRRRPDVAPPVANRLAQREQMAEVMRQATPKPMAKQSKHAAALVHVRMMGTVAVQMKDAAERRAVIEDIRAMLRARLSP